jgi:hypothetical protein
MPDERGRLSFEQFLCYLADIGTSSEAESPTLLLSDQFFASGWESCRDGLLKRTRRIRAWPSLPGPPRVIRFEIDCPFKCKRALDAPVELKPGPIRGTIIYRRDLFAVPDEPLIAVLLDQDQDYFHPNYSRRHGALCLGALTETNAGPVPLSLLLENHLFPILSYQNRRPAHPADVEAAQYFALNPAAMRGLEPVAPLY